MRPVYSQDTLQGLEQRVATRAEVPFVVQLGVASTVGAGLVEVVPGELAAAVTVGQLPTRGFAAEMAGKCSLTEKGLDKGKPAGPEPTGWPAAAAAEPPGVVS